MRLHKRLDTPGVETQQDERDHPYRPLHTVDTVLLYILYIHMYVQYIDMYIL